jgi:hypothetical protein
MVHWDLRESIKKTDIEVILQVVQSYLGGTVHLRTSPFYPQSNGKIGSG